MLKVQVLYKVSMYETDWTMTEEEYSEFIASTQGLPRPMLQKNDPVALEDIRWPGGKSPTLAKDQEIASLHKLLQEKDAKMTEMNIFYEGRDTKRIQELTEELEAMTLKAKGMVEKPYWKDFPGDMNTATDITRANRESLLSMQKVAQELSKGMDLKEFMDQPAWKPKAVEIIPEAPKIVPIVPEKVQEKLKKAKIEPDDRFKAPSSLNTLNKKPGRQGRDYTKHLKMLDNNDPVNDIVKALIEDYKLTKAAAQSTYNNIKRTHERRKINQNLAESKEKVSVIPSNPVTIVKPGHPKLPRNLREELACMPYYESAIHFKDAVITREYCSLYDIATLKTYYKETHVDIKW